jgi:HCOMODA/2-hydroxy-3-carboxy-muconic semialdehyde decarboxylase
MSAPGVAQAARVLAGLGLVTAFGHVSARSGDTVWITPPIEPALAEESGLVPVPLAARELPPGAPPETWLHLAVYRARPDVRAVARAQPESAFVLGAIATELVPLHGQASWLGRRVAVHPEPRLQRSVELASAAAESLGDADAVVLRGNGALTTGATPGAAVARMWLLDMACRIRVQAGQAGDPLPLSEDEIEAWRAAAPSLLERLWKHLLRISDTEGTNR